jgi:hypothetical protein
MPAKTTDLKVRDVSIKLHRAGQGPAVLLLHGAPYASVPRIACAVSRPMASAASTVPISGPA